MLTMGAWPPVVPISGTDNNQKTIEPRRIRTIQSLSFADFDHPSL